MLSFLIADDHAIVRNGLRHLIKSNFKGTVKETSSGAELLEQIKDNDFDLVLMDINMPDTDPKSILQNIFALKPNLNVIIVSMNKEVVFGKLYHKLGAMAYLQKGEEEREFVKAIKCVLSGNVYIAKSMRNFYLGKTTDNNNDGLSNPFGLLSNKEIEILPYLANGDTVTNIAKLMRLSSSTIGTHKAKILRKLHVENVFELKRLVDIYPLR